jgi:hypothetical protein
MYISITDTNIKILYSCQLHFNPRENMSSCRDKAPL